MFVFDLRVFCLFLFVIVIVAMFEFHGVSV